MKTGKQAIKPEVGRNLKKFVGRSGVWTPNFGGEISICQVSKNCS